MVKKGVILVISLLILSLLILGVYAQDETSTDTTEPSAESEEGVEEVTEEPIQEPEETPETEPIEIPEILEEAGEEFEDAELKESSGITPDSGFYFVEDVILSRFRDDIANREKKIAEIKAMIENGNIDAARVALERYDRYADNLEREISPEKREDARRSAAAIHNAIESIRDEIPESDREEFIDSIIEKEGKIVTAAEIAGKIKELCVQLSELDPLEYSRVCKTEGDVPRWQKDMNRKLTAEQEQEAKEFFEIMSQCFKTSGRECRCEDIKVSAFSEKCSTIAPLAAACDEGNKEACDEMEEIEQEEPIEDLLPDYLQDVLFRLQGRYKEDRFEMNMPPECVDEGAKTPKDCMKVMFRIHAPEECQQALEEGKIDSTNEKEAREACDKIMFEANAPLECVEAGATNPKECGKIMFQLGAPEECIEAGLTGESRGDDKKCREIMESQRGEERRPRGPEGGFGGGNCRAIQDPIKRLECYDSVSQGFEGQFERAEMERKEVREYKQEGGQKCPDGICDEFEKSRSYACPEDCGGVREERESEEFQQPPEGEFREGEFQPPQEGFQQPPEGYIPPSEGEGTTAPPETTTESGGGGEGGEVASEPTPTGAVVFNDRFSDYYFR